MSRTDKRARLQAAADRVAADRRGGMNAASTIGALTALHGARHTCNSSTNRLRRDRDLHLVRHRRTARRLDPPRHRPVDADGRPRGHRTGAHRMTAALTIAADGIRWPLDTFIDAYRYLRCDGDRPVQLPRTAATRLELVDRCGTVLRDVWADRVYWPDILAWRPVEHTASADPCRCCGQFALRDDDDLCAECAELADEVGMRV